MLWVSKHSISESEFYHSIDKKTKNKHLRRVLLFSKHHQITLHNPLLLLCHHSLTLPPSTHFSHFSFYFSSHYIPLYSPDVSHFSFTVFSSYLAIDSIYVDTPTTPFNPLSRFSFELNSPGTISTTFSPLLPLYSPDTSSFKNSITLTLHHRPLGSATSTPISH